MAALKAELFKEFDNIFCVLCYDKRAKGGNFRDRPPERKYGCLLPLSRYIRGQNAAVSELSTSSSMYEYYILTTPCLSDLDVDNNIFFKHVCFIYYILCLIIFQ